MNSSPGRRHGDWDKNDSRGVWMWASFSDRSAGLLGNCHGFCAQELAVLEFDLLDLASGRSQQPAAGEWS